MTNTNPFKPGDTVKSVYTKNPAEVVGVTYDSIQVQWLPGCPVYAYSYTEFELVQAANPGPTPGDGSYNGLRLTFSDGAFAAWTIHDDTLDDDQIDRLFGAILSVLDWPNEVSSDLRAEVPVLPIRVPDGAEG